ncbi:hypothetical protein [Haloglycomyces albus]|uniref:hypothetical protein n=1 Tax=Haloglycomyces albus TaxID=526067 RepID=UPI00046CD3B8|nr:hypothetical protein [Haloglycomyces albus]
MHRNSKTIRRVRVRFEGREADIISLATGLSHWAIGGWELILRRSKERDNGQYHVYGVFVKEDNQ